MEVNNVLLTIKVVTSDKGWRIKYNDEYIEDVMGGSAWDNLSDALIVLRSKLEFLDLDKQ
jgi:hypothetical protein